MKRICVSLFVVVLSNFNAAQAQVFKCTFPSGKVLFQEDECPPETRQESMKIKPMAPEQRAESEERLRLWQIEQEEKDSRKRKDEQEKQAEVTRLEEVEALKRSAIAQEDLAETKRREIELLERGASTYNNQPYYPLVIPYHNKDRRPHRRDKNNWGPRIDQLPSGSVNQGNSSDSVNIISRPRR